LAGEQSHLPPACGEPVESSGGVILSFVPLGGTSFVVFISLDFQLSALNFQLRSLISTRHSPLTIWYLVLATNKIGIRYSVFGISS